MKKVKIVKTFTLDFLVKDLNLYRNVLFRYREKIMGTTKIMNYYFFKNLATRILLPAEI